MKNSELQIVVISFSDDFTKNSESSINTLMSLIFNAELGNHSQSNQIVVINLTIVIHIQVIITFFSLFHSQVIFKSFAKKKAIF